MRSLELKRFPKDLASTLMSVACVEALLLHDQVKTPYGWEAAAYGTRPREGDSGPKNRGTLDRNRSGFAIMLPARLHALAQDRLGVSQTAQSPLWGMLRHPRMLSDEQLLELEPAANIVVNERFSLVGVVRRAGVNVELIERLAACGTFDAVAALWSLLLEAETKQRPEIALTCARHLPVAVALLGASPVGNRLAFLILARLRQLCLDRIACQGRRLALAEFDFCTVQASAHNLPPLELERAMFMKGSRVAQFPLDRSAIGKTLIVPLSRAQWIRDALPTTRGARGPRTRHVWRRDLGPLIHPLSPCRAETQPKFHGSALKRIRRSLGDYA